MAKKHLGDRTPEQRKRDEESEEAQAPPSDG